MNEQNEQKIDEKQKIEKEQKIDFADIDVSDEIKERKSVSTNRIGTWIVANNDTHPSVAQEIATFKRNCVIQDKSERKELYRLIKFYNMRNAE